MPHATARTVLLHGAVGFQIDVQADVSPGQVGVTLVGRADASLNEARDRCRMAIINSGLPWPATKRITVLLTPADLIKTGSHFDLAICAALLAADGTVKPEELRDTAFIGELNLSGGLRCVRGVLPMTLAAAERGIKRVIVPEPQLAEASMVPGMEVLGMRSLGQVIAELMDVRPPEAPEVPALAGSSLLSWRGSERLEELDFADLFGLTDTKYAVEVAAAGGHSLLLSGPKGAGKTSIAERIPTILPELLDEEALELTAIHSLVGPLPEGSRMLRRAPYAAPHHDASKTSVVGGGSGHVKPGEISRSHGGVLFLDEFPLFRTDVIEALRQPLESGEITVARGEESVTFPARTMVVLACNPCPCGEYFEDPTLNRCRCREQKRRDYRSRITGPIADRIDVTRHVLPLRPVDRDPTVALETSAEVRARVKAARQRQHLRFTGRTWRLNGHLPGPVLRSEFPLTPEAMALVDDRAYAGRLSSRGAARVLRLAWTIADLASVRTGQEVLPGCDEANLALALRGGEALPSAAVRRAG